jgi:hypothetical protein
MLANNHNNEGIKFITCDIVTGEDYEVMTTMNAIIPMSLNIST